MISVRGRFDAHTHIAASGHRPLPRRRGVGEDGREPSGRDRCKCLDVEIRGLEEGWPRRVGRRALKGDRWRHRMKLDEAPFSIEKHLLYPREDHWVVVPGDAG